MKNRSIAGMCCGVLSMTALAASPAAAGDAGKIHLSAPRVTPFTIASSKTQVAALINPDGTIVYSKGIKAVTNLQAGVYCVTLYPKIDATAVAPVMAFNYDSTGDYAVTVAYSPFVGQDSCPANSVGVVTLTVDSGTHVLTNEGFTIAIP